MNLGQAILADFHQIPFTKTENKMATFELFSKRKQEEDLVTKYPIKKIEMAIEKFIKVVGIDLDRLEKHKDNIEKVSEIRISTTISWNIVIAT